MKRYLRSVTVPLLFLAAFVDSCKDAGTEPPPPPQPPSISSITPDSAFAGDTIKIEGAHFGSSRGTSTVSFGGTDAGVYAEWKDTEIKVQIPSTVGSGSISVIVTVGDRTSPPKSYRIRAVQNAPIITSVQPDSGIVGDQVSIKGSAFGSTKGTSSVTFTSNVAASQVVSWSDTVIVVKVPSGAITGNVSVTVNGLTSNGKLFRVFVVGNLTYTSDVRPILSTNCTPCHWQSPYSSNFNQTTYSTFRAGGDTYHSDVIIPGDSLNSGIMQALRNRNSKVGWMPLGTTTGIKDSLIKIIGSWIVQGAKQ